MKLNKKYYDDEGWHLCPCCGSEMQVYMTTHPSSNETCFHLECTNENCALTYGQNWNYFDVQDLKKDWNNNQLNNQKKSSNIKPCPFCGKIPTRKYDEHLKKWYIQCENEKCRIQPFTDAHTNKSVITKEWNKRV